MKKLSFVFDTHLSKPEVCCKLLKDNQICVSVAESNKLSPRTKHIAIKYHHFQIFIKNIFIHICYIDTQEQTAEIFIKSLDR